MKNCDIRTPVYSQTSVFREQLNSKNPLCNYLKRHLMTMLETKT